MNKSLFTIIIITFFISFFTVSTHAENMVGFINLRRLVNESEMGKTAQKDLLALKEEKETVLKAKLQEIEALKDSMDKSKDDPDSEEMRKNNLKLNRMYKDYKRLEDDAKEDMSIGDRELVAKIMNAADTALKKVAKKKNYLIILKDPNAIGYLDPDVDITDDVLKELNK